MLDGAEGVGKSTQIRRLAEHLERRGERVLLVREPGGTAVGEAIRTLLLDPGGELGAVGETLLFLASRAELVERVIAPALVRGETVLADRFFLSTYAYQGAARGLDLEQVRAANRFATGGLVPDLTILLHLPVARGLERAAVRGGHDRMERVGGDFHERVQRAFEAFLDPAWQAAHCECGRIVGTSGEGGEVEVFERVLAAMRERWPETFSPRAESHQ